MLRSVQVQHGKSIEAINVLWIFNEFFSTSYAVRSLSLSFALSIARV